MQEVYDMPSGDSPYNRPECRSVGRRTVIEEAKKVPTIDLADLLCGPGRMRRIGNRWVAKCPLPGHDERTPSFTVFLETNSWYCFGACQRGGDVVDLAAAAWSIDRADVAAAEVLMCFGHDVPQRLPSWFAKQRRQKPVRDRLEQIRIHLLQRRLFRLFEPMISKAGDPDERAEEARYVWEELSPLAVRLYESRRGTSE